MIKEKNKILPKRITLKKLKTRKLYAECSLEESLTESDSDSTMLVRKTSYDENEDEHILKIKKMRSRVKRTHKRQKSIIV